MKLKHMNLCCWNIRTLLDKVDGIRPERRTAIVAKELARYNIGIAALSETRLAGESDRKEDGSGYTFFWIGKGENERRESGVGFLLLCLSWKNPRHLLRL